MTSKDRSEIEKIIGYEFKDARILENAFTHQSFTNENGSESYERLEFLGDAVAGLIVSTELYRRFPEMDEGRLTRLRSKIVSNETESERIRPYGLSRYMRFGVSGKNDGLASSATVLSDLFEAIVGAIYADSLDMNRAKPFVMNVLGKAISDAVSGKIEEDCKSKVLEFIAKAGKKAEFRELSKSGPSHAPVFVMGLFINGEPKTEAQGKNKKEAEQKAAKLFLDEMRSDKL